MSNDSHDHPLFAAVYDPLTRPFESRLEPHRRWLMADLSRIESTTPDSILRPDSTLRILDVGSGTGAMFPFYAAASSSATSRGLSVVAVEPDAHMRERAERRARECGLDVTLVDAGAESLPLADESVDVVVASLVLCTVSDLDAALDEFSRVLRPGGELRVLEHVRADGRLARGQELLTPAWKHVAAGCHLARPTGEVLLADDRFTVVEYDTLDVGVPPVAPFVRGRFRRRGPVRAGGDGDSTESGRISRFVDTLLPSR